MSKFKKALQHLRKIHDKHGHTFFLDDLVSKSTSGVEKATYTTLDNEQLDFLDAIGLQYRFREDIMEWDSLKDVITKYFTKSKVN